MVAAREIAFVATTRSFYDRGSCTAIFGDVASRAPEHGGAPEQMGSGRSSAGRKEAQRSAVRHEPITLEQKFAALKKKIEDGDFALPQGVTTDRIWQELKNNRDAYQDLSLDKIEEKLKTEAKLLLDVKAPVHKPMDPGPMFGLAALAFAPRAPAPAFY